MTDDIDTRIEKRASLILLGYSIKAFDEAVESGSAGLLLTAGTDLRNIALEVAKLHS